MIVAIGKCFEALGATTGKQQHCSHAIGNARRVDRTIENNALFARVRVSVVATEIGEAAHAGKLTAQDAQPTQKRCQRRQLPRYLSKKRQFELIELYLSRSHE